MSDNRVRILVFSSLFPHEGEPTLGIFVENRLRQLLKHEDVEATVVAPVPWFPFKGSIFGRYGRAAKAARFSERDGLKIYHPRYLVIPKIGMVLTPFFLFWSALFCIKKLMRRGLCFDLIDAHYLFPDGVAATRLGATLKKPVVLTARGSDVTEIALYKKPRRAIIEAVKKAAHTVTVSNNLRRDLMEMGANAEEITVLRNGVDTDRFYPINREEMRKSWSGRKILLFAGWLIPRKRVDLVLAVTARIPELTTLIVGDGPLREALVKQAEQLRIKDRVFFLGQKKPSEMPEIFSAADVLLLPSDREGWANVLLEAMACGTPVVSRAIGGAPDLITEDVAGRVVEGEDVADLALAVESILSNPPERNSTVAFAKEFDWRATSLGQKKIFDAAIQVYQKKDDKRDG